MSWPGTPFLHQGRPHWPLIALFVAIHAVLLFDAIAHDPWIGYDGEAHLQYIDPLSRLRLPGMDDTPEWYSPPLPYLAPALARMAGLGLTASAKVGQIVNVAFSCALCFYLLRICELMRPGCVSLKLWALGLLGMLPVYHRTFSYVRGEPLLAAAAVFAAHESILLCVSEAPTRRRALRAGAGLSAMLLARQWGFFLLPAFGLLALVALKQWPERRRALVSSAITALVVCVLVGGWFYAHLAVEYGSVKAFGRGGSRSFSLSNQPASFYLGLGLDRIFTDPVRPSFTNQLLPVFYSDTWVDYWCYFVVRARDTRTGTHLSGFYFDRALESSARPDWLETNRDDVGGYLGRVNLVSLSPTAVLLGGLVMGVAACATAALGAFRSRHAAASGAIGSRPPVERGPADSPHGAIIRAFLFLLIAFTMVGYFWFLVMYPSLQKGRTIKPSYGLQVFPFLALLGGELMVAAAQRWPRTGRWLAVAMGGCALHNLPAMITRFFSWS